MEERTDRHDRHEGWANYETWTVNLWLENDSRQTIERTMRVIRAGYAKGEAQAKEYGWAEDLDKLGRSYAADALRDWIADKLPQDPEPAGSLARCAMVRVDWLEIVASWLEQRS